MSVDLLDLFRRPQKAIATAVAEDNEEWLLPMLGYAFLSLAEGFHRTAERMPTAHPLLVIFTALGLVLLLGAWLSAISYGGALHLGARVLRGRPGLRQSIQAVGFALFWPGLFGATAAVLFSLTYERSTALGCTFAFVNASGGIWALYTTVAAIRARHELSWWRAIVAWLLAMLTIGGAGLAIHLALRS